MQLKLFLSELIVLFSFKFPSFGWVQFSAFVQSVCKTKMTMSAFLLPFFCSIVSTTTNTCENTMNVHSALSMLTRNHKAIWEEATLPKPHSPYMLQCAAHFIPKCASSCGGSGPPSNAWSFGPPDPPPQIAYRWSQLFFLNTHSLSTDDRTNGELDRYQ